MVTHGFVLPLPDNERQIFFLGGGPLVPEAEGLVEITVIFPAPVELETNTPNYENTTKPLETSISDESTRLQN